jgi:hypothetical protein
MQKFNELNQLLTPLNQTWGEHSVTVTFFPGSEGGYMKFLLNWKTENLEVEFNNLDEALEKAKSIINQLEPSLQEVWNDWNSDDENGDEDEEE